MRQVDDERIPHSKDGINGHAPSVDLSLFLAARCRNRVKPTEGEPFHSNAAVT